MFQEVFGTIHGEPEQISMDKVYIIVCIITYGQMDPKKLWNFQITHLMNTASSQSDLIPQEKFLQTILRIEP